VFHVIKSIEDIHNFIDKTNALHDGYVVGVQYTNNGVSKTESGHYLEPDKTKLTLRILVTSIRDAVVEIEFEDLLEWQIKNRPFYDITNTSVYFNEKGRLVWMDDIDTNTKEMKQCSYVIAGSMKWRMTE